MVFGLFGPWDTTTPGSTSKMNGVTVISGTGDDLATLDKTQYVIVKCTVSGSGLIADHVYETSADGTSFIDISSIAEHDHSGLTDGGRLIDIFRYNPKYVDTGAYFTTNQEFAKYVTAVSGTGAVTDDVDGTTEEKSILLDTGATSGSGSNIRQRGILLDFGQRSFYQVKLRIGTLSSVTLRSGVQCDRCTDADSNNKQYCAEVCTVTNNNWFLRTASGSAHTASDTTITATTNRVGIRMVHFPDVSPIRVDMYVDASAAFQKTTNIPASGANSNVNNLFRTSIKNSTAASRTLYNYANRIAYVALDSWI